MAGHVDSSDIRISDARREDAPFLGWVLQTASRSHLDRGALEIFVGGSDEDCLRFLGALTLTEARHFAKYDNFIIARSERQQVGALCGYFVDDVEPVLGKAAAEVATQLGWSDEDLDAARRRITANSYVPVERVPRAWVVESVAVVTAFRRRGILDKMLDEILERGRQRGATQAEVTVFIGNDVGQRAYEKAGFAVASEVRNAEYEAAFGTPGVRLMRRAL